MKKFDLLTHIKKGWDDASYAEKLSLIRVGKTVLGNLEKELSTKCPGSQAAAIGASLTRDESKWQTMECPECGERVEVEGYKYPPVISVHERKDG